jgi:two-component system, chemotaxis family, sensor kinase Cph1
MNEYRQGEHICAVHESRDEQLAVAAEYLAHGLLRGERCYYVAASTTAFEDFHRALRLRGVDVERALESTALVEATHAEAHLVDGRFDCERMISMLNRSVEQALNDGFLGLRTCGDMSWLIGDPPGAEHVVEYEALLNQFFHGARACGMCQYDRHRLPPLLLDHALSTHSSAVVSRRHKKNPFYLMPSAAAGGTGQPANLVSKLEQLRKT